MACCRIYYIYTRNICLYPQGFTVSSYCNSGGAVHMLYTDKCQYCDTIFFPQRSLIICLERNFTACRRHACDIQYAAIPAKELGGSFGRTCLFHQYPRMSLHVYVLYDLFQHQFLLNGNQCPFGSKLSIRKARGWPR